MCFSQPCYARLGGSVGSWNYIAQLPFFLRWRIQGFLIMYLTFCFYLLLLAELFKGVELAQVYVTTAGYRSLENYYLILFRFVCSSFSLSPRWSSTLLMLQGKTIASEVFSFKFQQPKENESLTLKIYIYIYLLNVFPWL